jgi:transposase
VEQVWLTASELIEAGASDWEVTGRSGSRACRRAAGGGIGQRRPTATGLARGRRGPLQTHPWQLRELQTVLDAGPAAWGWDEDQCWTVPQIAELVHRRFGVGYTPAGLDLMLHRIGWSVQVPARQATERDEAAIARWREEPWPVIKDGGGPGRLALASKTNQARA